MDSRNGEKSWGFGEERERGVLEGERKQVVLKGVEDFRRSEGGEKAAESRGGWWTWWIRAAIKLRRQA